MMKRIRKLVCLKCSAKLHQLAKLEKAGTKVIMIEGPQPAGYIRIPIPALDTTIYLSRDIETWKGECSVRVSWEATLTATESFTLTDGRRYKNVDVNIGAPSALQRPRHRS